MKFKSILKNIGLESRFFLYLVTITYFLNLILFMFNNNTTGSVLLVLIAGLIYFGLKIKNMVYVLGIPLIFVTLYRSIGIVGRKMEGMENNKDDLEKEKDETKNSEDTKLKKTIQKINKNAPTSSQGLVMTPLDHSNEPTVNTNESSATTDESFEVGRSKKNSKGYNVDYASTIEDAYDDLNKILGSDGIQRLTNDTQKLMKQQLQLAESMKSMQPLIAGMGPLMEQAKGLLGNIGDSGNLNNLTEMAKKLSSSMGK
jgi:uncharacterized membrane protein (DUF106 family)